MKKHINYLKENFYSSIGFHLLHLNFDSFSFFDLNQSNENKLKKLTIVEKEKQDILIKLSKKKEEYKVFQNFILKYKNLTGSCNASKSVFCGKVDCIDCANKYYIYKLANNKNDGSIGLFTLNSQILLDILGTRINSSIKYQKEKKKSANKNFIPVYFKNTSILSTETKIKNGLNLIEEILLEKNFFSSISNIVFFELNFKPIALDEKKIILNPIFLDVTNRYLKHLNNNIERNHINKSIISFIKLVNFEQFSKFSLLDSQKSSNNMIISVQKLSQEIVNLPQKTLKQIIAIIKKYKTVVSININTLSNKQPYNALSNAAITSFIKNLTNPQNINLFKPIKNPFKSSDYLQFVLNECVVSNVILFQFLDLKNNSTSNSTYSPTKSQVDFINSYNLYSKNDQLLAENLNNTLNFINLPIDKIILCKNCGMQIFHSRLQLLSAVNLLNFHASRKKQFNFITLNCLCNDFDGINFIKFCFFISENIGEAFAKIKNPGKKKMTEIITFKDLIPIIDGFIRDEKSIINFNSSEITDCEIAFFIDTPTFKKMKSLAITLNLSMEQYKLISLRFEELLVFLNVESLDKTSYWGGLIYRNTITDILRFMVFEATSISQIDYIHSDLKAKYFEYSSNNTQEFIHSFKFKNSSNIAVNQLDNTEFLSSTICAQPEKKQRTLTKKKFFTTFKKIVYKNFDLMYKIFKTQL